MSTVKLHPAEHLMNWLPRHTKLYIRGAKGASIEKLQELDKELHTSFIAFFDDLVKRGDIEINVIKINE
jgi:hypothetical protein